MNFPSRILVGRGNKTIPNPAILFADKDAVVYEGPVSGYDFKRQKKNYEKLEAILNSYGSTLEHIASARYKGSRGENTRFIVSTSDKRLMWYKYVGHSELSGQNHVFIAGMRIKLSIFIKDGGWLSLTTRERDALMTGDRLFVKLILSEKRVRWLDEINQLWS